MSTSDHRVRLFGEPLLDGPDGECRLSPFQGALLTLVFAERSISRPRVAQLLWGREADTKTRQGIRQLKNEIRRRAGVHIIHADGDMLSASPEVDSDLESLDVHLESGRLAKAAALIVTGFGDATAGGIADAFEDWKCGYCNDIHGRILRQASAKWESSTRENDWRAARDAAEAMYTLTPGAEATARVIEARARVGRLQSAEVAYAEFQDRHRADDPIELVEDVIARVRSLSTESDTPAREAPVPFVGRKDPLARLTSIFDDVRRGRFSFALVTGEAGIGKTRLLRELERAAGLEGLRCLRAQPVELERRISLNPIIDALSVLDLDPHLTAIGEPWRTVIGTMLPPGPHAEPVQALPPIEERSLSRRLLDAFSLLFRSIANEQPTLFFLDDLQWADATTIAALQFYQRRWKESFFGVITTVRPGAVSNRDPAASYLSDDGKLGVQRVNLDELKPDEARQLVEYLGDDRIEEADVAKLCALSGRHPLYLTELTRDYLSGRLVLPMSEADAFSIPVSLKQILASRMEAISDRARSVLNVLAVGSKPMRLSDLGELLELSLDHAADAADELRQRRLVELERDRLWIAHDLFRTAIYRELSEAHRAVLHHRLAESIRKGSGEEAATELAIHLDRAGRAELSAKYGWTAAGRAFERGAVAEAAHFYELVTRNESDSARRAEATAHLAMSLHLNRDISRANPALELASTRLRSAGMTELARRMDIRRVEGLAEAGDTPVDELVERLRAIKHEAREAEDWEGVALALDVELQQLQLAERLEAVRALFTELESVLEKGDRIAAAIAYQGLSVGLMLEDPRAALSAARNAVSLISNQNADRRLKALNRLIIVLLQQGSLQLEANQKIVSEARAIASRSGDLVQRFSFEHNLGVSLMDAGDLDGAEVYFDRAGKLLGEAETTFSRINLAINRAELALARKDFTTAAGFLESVATLPGLAIPRYTERLVNAGLGTCALETGRIAEARTRFESMGEPPSTWYYDPTIILTFGARFLERQQALQEAIELLERAQADLHERLVPAWIKTQLTLARLAKKAANHGFRRTAREGLQVARSLQLRTRAREFELLLSDTEP